MRTAHTKAHPLRQGQRQLQLPSGLPRNWGCIGRGHSPDGQGSAERQAEEADECLASEPP
ncbi:unnamed protein product [Prunus armeniaca]